MHARSHVHRELSVPRMTEQHNLTPQDGAICITDYLVLVPSASSQAQPTQRSGVPRTLCAPAQAACILDNVNALSFRTGLAFFGLCYVNSRTVIPDATNTVHTLTM